MQRKQYSDNQQLKATTISVSNRPIIQTNSGLDQVSYRNNLRQNVYSQH